MAGHHESRLERQVLRRNDRSAETAVLNTHESRTLAFDFGLLGNHRQERCGLSHGFNLNHAREHRIVREMTVKELFLARHVPNSNDRRLVTFGDFLNFVHESKRSLLREEGMYLFFIVKHRATPFLRLFCGSSDHR